MTISCGCNDSDGGEPGQIGAYAPDDYSVYEGRRRTRCCSCGRTVSPGDTVARFDRFKVPKHEIEKRIYGEDGEVPLASKYHCERCADLWFSIQDYGYCADYEQDMRTAAKEVAAAERINPGK